MAYFNGHDANISIETSEGNEVLLDQSVTLEFSESFQKMPIYGYKSVLADEILLGEKLVQGQLGLNLKGSFSLDSEIQQGKDDTAYTPPLADDPLISQNTFDIKIQYTKTDYTKENRTWHTPEKASLELRIKDVTITGMQSGFSTNATPALEFYNFIAKRVITTKPGNN